MTPLQRLLRDEYLEADKKVSHLAGTKPEIPETVSQDEAVKKAWQDYRDKAPIWSADWNEALGYRDGLRRACVLAEVFKD